MITTGWFDIAVGGARLAGTRLGTGEAMVFLHAGVADRRMWAPQMAAFGDEQMVIAYDRRGFGQTVSLDEPFSPVGDLRAVLDHLGIEKAALVGCSQGGLVAIDFALAYPERVSALALIAPAVSGAPKAEQFSPQVQTLVDALDAAEEVGDLTRVNELEAHLWLDGPTSAAGRVEGELRDLFLDMNGIALQMPELTHEMKPAPAYPHLSELLLPTVVIWGELDFLFVKERCRHLVAEISTAQGQEIVGAAHLVSWEKAEAVNTLLRDFLASATS